MVANPSIKKRERERKRQERQRLKAGKREQRKLDRVNRIAPIDSAADESPLDPTDEPRRDG